MTSDSLLSASLVFDGFDPPTVPHRMGRPRADQLRGTNHEQLCELAGRVCYDSLGKGRASDEYHSHILEVGHLSVYEHANFTVEFECEDIPLGPLFAHVFINRPGVFLVQRSPHIVRVTANLRTVLEWDEWTGDMHVNGTLLTCIRSHMLHAAHAVAPNVIACDPGGSRNLIPGLKSEIVPGDHAEEMWITMLLTGSRGFSHELVRHGDRTAISQRSTRYVDESTSPWVTHPLAAVFEASGGRDCDAIFPEDGGRVPWSAAGFAQDVYVAAVDSLQPWLVERGVDKHTARKQARGAARGFLGNALYTEVIFSASALQWRRMIQQRLSAAADAEIREVFAHVVRELRKSFYSDYFLDMHLVPSLDGIGEVLRDA